MAEDKVTEAEELKKLEADIKALDAVPVVPPKPKAKSKGDYTHYISTEAEPVGFDIKVAGEDIRSSRSPTGSYLQWRVPKDLAKRFEAHHHFVKGRIKLNKD